MNALAAAVSHNWNESIVPQLVEYIRIPAKSPHFDPQWEANGHIERVIRLAESWVRQQPVRGLALEIVRLPGRTPRTVFRRSRARATARFCCTAISTSSPK